MHQLSDELLRKYASTLEQIASDLEAVIGHYGVERSLSHCFPYHHDPDSSVILSGISGSGKSTVGLFLEKRGYRKFRNVTTRPPRPTEQADEQHFVSEQEFTSLETSGELFFPHERNGVRQALLRREVEQLEAGSSRFWMDKSVASCVKLIRNVEKIKERTQFVYFFAPDLTVLFTRILQREYSAQKSGNSLNETAILHRFQEEIEDMRQIPQVPYCFVINDELEKTLSLFTNA
ncbi:hypothetical protein GVX82_00940 [Patescibacteria group bacterium]|jgi:guanylate kinase|nr:hypothetical protein [Patescibacteria group bacterium]